MISLFIPARLRLIGLVPYVAYAVILLVMGGCISSPHVSAGAGHPPTGGGVPNPGDPFHDLRVLLEWLGTALIISGAGSLIAGCIVSALGWLRSLGAALLAFGIGCFVIVAVIDYLGKPLIWGCIIVGGIMLLPVLLGWFRYLERRFGVDLEPGPGPGPGPGDPVVGNQSGVSGGGFWNLPAAVADRKTDVTPNGDK
jgi:hypothetical protein